MTLENFTNIAQTTLSADLSGTADTTMSVTSDVEFPQSPQFRIKVVDEIMLVTSLPMANTFIVERGVENTIPSTYVTGAEVNHILTAEGFGRAVRGDMVYGIDTGTANAYATSLQPALTEYTEGVIIHLRPSNNNTGASTINVDSLGITSIKKNFTLDLGTDDIVQDEISVLAYDGTNFQLLHPPIHFIDNENLSATADGTVTIFATTQSYANNSIKVYWNGLRALKGTDYNETDSTSFTFTTAPDATDNILVDYQTNS